jgi:hypothetical protein
MPLASTKGLARTVPHRYEFCPTALPPLPQVTCLICRSVDRFTADNQPSLTEHPCSINNTVTVRGASIIGWWMLNGDFLRLCLICAGCMQVRYKPTLSQQSVHVDEAVVLSSMRVMGQPTQPVVMVAVRCSLCQPMTLRLCDSDKAP